MPIREQVLADALRAADFEYTPAPPLETESIERFLPGAHDHWRRASWGGWWIDVWGREANGLHEKITFGLSKRPNKESLVPERVFLSEEALKASLSAVLSELDELAEHDKLSCPVCGARLVVRVQKMGPDPGSTFLGCVNYQSKYAGCLGKRTSIAARRGF